MNEEIRVPPTLNVNAWDGSRSPKADLSKWLGWVKMSSKVDATGRLAAAPLVDDRDWTLPGVGWGIVAADTEDYGAADKAAGKDLPESLGQLLARRKGPILRFRKDLRAGHLRRYYEDGSAQDLSTGAPTFGTGKGCIPRYILIYGSPSAIPWYLQYALNLGFFVGRIDLEGEQLENYVAALLDDWKDEAIHPSAPVLWSVDHGKGDISWLMARVVGLKLKEALAADADMKGLTWLSGSDATHDNLLAKLAAVRPGLVCTTSHGMTGPLDDAKLLAAQLGTLVDANYKPLGLERSLAAVPSGAIWYAHACCSAGSDERSAYADVLGEQQEVGAMLRGVCEAAGARVAPLPRALLGCKRPLRAFVGHVEPTFDWTLRDPANKQVVANSIVSSLYSRLHQPEPSPIGWSLQPIFRESAAFFGTVRADLEAANRNVVKARERALYATLVARDRQMVVVLGDPTVSLPRPLSN